MVICFFFYSIIFWSNFFIKFLDHLSFDHYYFSITKNSQKTMLSQNLVFFTIFFITLFFPLQFLFINIFFNNKKRNIVKLLSFNNICHHYKCFTTTFLCWQKHFNHKICEFFSQISSTFYISYYFHYLHTVTTVTAVTTVTTVTIWLMNSWNGNFFSRPGQSQGLLYKHPRHWLIHWFIQWAFSTHSFTALPRPKG